MLNRISLTDIITYLTGKIRLLLWCAVIFALLLGSMRYAMIMISGTPSDEELQIARDAMDQSEAVCIKGDTRQSAIPISGIDPYCTFTSSVALEINAVNGPEIPGGKISSLIDSVLARWEISDLRKPFDDLYSDPVDDTALRQVVEVQRFNESTFILKTKEKNEINSEKSAEALLVFVRKLINDEAGRLGLQVTVTASQIETMCSYDYSVTVEQYKEKNRLEEYRKVWENDCERYNSLLHESDITGRTAKWAVIGLVLGPVVMLLLFVAYVLLYEPVLSQEHVNRQTGLECLGSIKKNDKRENAYAVSRNDCTSVKLINHESADYASLRIQDKIDSSGPVLLVFADRDCSAEAVNRIKELLNNSGLGADTACGAVGNYEFLKKIKNAEKAVLVVKCGRTKSKELERILNMMETYKCEPVGFLCI
ncbi:MAG: hypothetical protein IKD87_08655 [Oscillospiraceae bacterium]|nr:hypothetical protein [Oscillospiraceae bacterium]